jgi:hypothetical protein
MKNYSIILFTIVGIVGISLLSCDDRSNFLVNINSEPTIYFNGLTSTITISDSLKTSLKHGKNQYPFKLNFFDKENNLKAVAFKFVSGSGTISQDGTALQTELAITADFANLVFSPQGVGTVRIDFTAIDAFDASSSVSLTLNVFDNLLPIAEFKEAKLGVNSPYEYELDATKSRDLDLKKGGGIQAYHYIINGTNDIWTASPKTRIVFGGTGGQEVKLEVIDNDGGKSAFFTKVISVSN